MIRLYAITDHPGPPLPDVAPLRAVASGNLAAVCELAAEEEITPERLWRHEHVVETLMRDRDVLPVRYGTTVADEAGAVRALQARHDQLAETLEFVRGAVEVSVRVAAADESPPHVTARQARSGREYLHARAGEVADRDRAARAVHQPLAAIARADAARPPRLRGELLCTAYLVGRDALEGFVARVAELQAANPALTISCTGPWPPYSFAER